METSGRVCLGVIVGAHGIRGEVKVRSFTEDAADIGAYGVLTDKSGQKSFAVKIVGHSKDDLRVKIEGCNDRNQAEALRGTELFVEREVLPETEDEEFYHTDLIGLEAKTESGKILGKVVAFYNFGAGDIVEIKVGEKLEMLPFNKDFVPEVCINNGYIIVREPVSDIENGEENEG